MNLLRRARIVGFVAAGQAGLPAFVLSVCMSGNASAWEFSAGARARGGGETGSRIEESFRWQARSLRTSLLFERDPGEARFADHVTGTALLRRGSCTMAAGDLRVSAPGLVFSARGPGSEPSWLSAPAPARFSAWDSPSEFGYLRGAGIVCEHRRAVVALAAGRTALDAVENSDGTLALSRSGDHARGSNVLRAIAREEALVASAWIGGRRAGLAGSIVAARYRPGFAKGAGEPAGGLRGSVAIDRRSGAREFWIIAASGLGGWDGSAGFRLDEETLGCRAALRASGGAGPRGARSPRAAGGRNAGVEAAQTITWTPRRSVQCRLEGAARLPEGGGPSRSFAAEALWRGGERSEWRVVLSSRSASKRAGIEWKSAVSPRADLSFSFERNAEGGTGLGAALESAPGSFRWSIGCASSSQEGSIGGGVIAAPAGGAVVGARAWWERGPLSVYAAGAWRAKKDRAGATIFSVAAERRWGRTGKREL